MLNLIKKLFAKQYQDLDGQAFKAAYQTSKGAVLLDVRTPSEYKAGTINGAKNINLTSLDFNSQIAKLPKDKEYFVFCRSGARSGNACRMMSAQGFKVTNLSGGIASWPR
jgi:rhodanese-related sulfurtransferase